jgi:hypothetical protein
MNDEGVDAEASTSGAGGSKKGISANPLMLEDEKLIP